MQNGSNTVFWRLFVYNIWRAYTRGKLESKLDLDRLLWKLLTAVCVDKQKGDA